MESPGPSKCALRLRLSFAALGLVVGVSVFPCFAFVFDNWSAGVWALLSGLVAMATLLVHILYVREYWPGRDRPLTWIMLSGCFVQLAGVCGFVTYLTLALVENVEFNVHGPNFYIVLVWCFMTLKWGMALFYYSRQYRNSYRKTGESRTSLLNGERDPATGVSA